MNSNYCVLIPAHNAEPFLAQALESVARQTIPPRRIVVVDDGSVDATAEVATAAGATVLRQSPAQGPSASRNLAVAASSEPIIAFLDADDHWMPHHAERLLTALFADGAVFAGSDAQKFGSESGVLSSTLESGDALDLRDRLVFENPVIQSSVMIERQAFMAAGGYDESMRLSEDYDLWSRVAERGRFAYVGTPTIHRRMHEAQATQQSSAGLVKAAWSVRRRTVSRRMLSCTPSEGARLVRLLVDASRIDLEWAIWTGDSAMLRLVRNEIEQTDKELGLPGDIGAVVGGAVRRKRLAEDLRCRSRALYHAILGAA
jgi:glycosyltransferase involved in cell wall biosynthesis